MSSYINSVKELFSYYKNLGERCFEQLNDKDIHFIPKGESNNIAILVKHMSGNMRSRFVNFRTEDGEKPWRNRDEEFVDSIESIDDLLKVWEAGWQEVFHAISGLSPSDLEEIVYIRNQGHTVIEALNRQLAHYAYHTGQIVFISKMIRGQEWESLSIPKGKSEEYNEAKFNKEKTRRHFTKDL